MVNVDDDLHIAGVTFEGGVEIGKGYASCDQGLQPGAVGLPDGVGRFFVVAAIGVNDAERDGVAENHAAVQLGDVDGGILGVGGGADHTKNAV